MVLQVEQIARGRLVRWVEMDNEREVDDRLQLTGTSTTTTTDNRQERQAPGETDQGDDGLRRNAERTMSPQKDKGGETISRMN